MGAPCINDTCSISSKIDPVTRRMEHSVNIAPAGGLKCVDGQGMAAEILGDPAAAAAIDTAFQQLGISPGGELWSIPKRAQLEAFSSASSAAIPHGGTDSASPIDTGGTMVNPFSSPAFALVIARHRVGWTIEQPVEGATLATQTFGIDWVPYSGQVFSALYLNGNDQPGIMVDIAGVHLRNNTISNRRRDSWSVHALTVGGGQPLVVTASARHHDPGNHLANIDTQTAPASSPVFAERGLSVRGQVIFLPFGGE